MRWFDTHCHLDRLPPSLPAEEALRRAVAAGVDHILVPGVAGWPRPACKPDNEVCIMTAWGVHPAFIDQIVRPPEDAPPWQSGQALPAAIGECGLDRRIVSPIEQQEKIFTWQLQLARQHALPVLVHRVGNMQRALDLLRSAGLRAGFVMHSWSGSAEMAAVFVAAGGLISLSASSLRNPEKLRRLFAAVPLQALLLETDAPDMPLPGWPQPCNEPAALPAIAAGVAEITGIRLEKLSEILYTNSLRVFGHHPGISG